MLKKLMDEHGLKNNALAKEIGVSHVAIGNYLAGRLPHSDILTELALFFKVPIEVLLGSKEPPQPTNAFVFSTDAANTKIRKLVVKIEGIQSELGIIKAEIENLIRKT